LASLLLQGLGSLEPCLSPDDALLEGEGHGLTGLPLRFGGDPAHPSNQPGELRLSFSHLLNRCHDLVLS
jgi:hypothetical protein